MDIKLFLKFVNRYKWLLILLPLATVTVTYFLVKKLPKQYKSNVEISTGLLDPTKKVITEQTTDFFKVSQQFSSIIEKLKMKKIINILSYNLILHDLEQPQKRFKTYSKDIDALNQQKRQDLIKLYRQKLDEKSLLTLNDDYGQYRLYSIIASMGYDEETLQSKIDITHAESSDLINIQYTSESPDLSVYVVNTLAREFIDNYTYDVNSNEVNSNELLDSIVKRTKRIMDEKSSALASFKLAKGVINLPEQAAAINTQISTYEAKREEISGKIDQDQAALDEINSELKGNDTYTAGSSGTDNRQLVSLHIQLQAATSNYIDHATAANHKKVDSLTTLYNLKRDQNSNDNVYDPRTSKQNLASQRQAKIVELSSLRASFKSIDSQLSELKRQFAQMMPYGGEIQQLGDDQAQAEKDYADALSRYNQSRTIQNVSGFHLEIAQIGLPNKAEPSKRVLYLAEAGFGSFALCLGFILVVFAMDHSIINLRQLERITKSKAIGALITIDGNERYIRNIWNDKSGNKNYEIYRDMLRALRFEIGNKMDADNSKILGVTSLFAKEGKTLFSYGLAYAFAMTGRKILLIADEVPIVQSNSKEVSTSQNFTSFLVKREINTADLITVLSKSTVQNSLLESQSIKSLLAGFEKLRSEFDLIIIDVDSLHNTNTAKEWLLFTEKNVAIFESGKSLNENDMELVNYIKNKPEFIGWIMNKISFSKH